VLVKLEVTVCVATYGAPEWARLARARAVPSAEREGVPVVTAHGEMLAAARNDALAEVTTPWVVFLDADDELEPGYIEAMTRGTADLRAPAVRYVEDGQAGEARVPRVVGHSHTCDPGCLKAGNWLVIGTLARTALVRAVGGFEAWPWCEDWALWARCWRAGASVEAVPAAVYRAHVRPDSRNRGVGARTRDATYEAIRRAIWPEDFPA
jgi:glycosyltransferase involved in cell wall biosynthesis